MAEQSETAYAADFEVHRRARLLLGVGTGG
jgi:hypothetical protein